MRSFPRLRTTQDQQNPHHDKNVARTNHRDRPNNDGSVIGPNHLTPSQNKVLQLQQTRGNMAVGRLLAGNSLPPAEGSWNATNTVDRSLQRGKLALPGTSHPHIQRALGDGHDLTSPRFAGDVKLEACFDNEARLSQGMQGGSVAAVQQALIDQGFDLGPAGADGIYGPATSNAVRQFKTKENLGSEQFGDVGPGTIGRLDQLFPAQAPDADVGDDGEQVCPVDDDIVTALEAQPAKLDALIGESTTAALTSAAVGSGGHISIQESVDRFKQKVNVSNAAGGTNISEKGQFFWGRQMAIAVEDEINRMSGEPSAAAFVAKARIALRLILSFQNATAQISELRRIAATSTSPEKPNMQALVRSHRISGGALESTLWGALNARPDDSLPELAPFRSLPTLQTLRKFDKVGCGTHARLVAERLKKKGGIKPPDAKARPIGINLVGGTLVRDRRPMGSPASVEEPAASAAVRPPSAVSQSTPHLGDFFRQTNVLTAVSQMQQALDAGQVIHARVMSGVGAGVEPDVRANPRSKRTQLGIPPPEEHSILIIGFDGSSFVFNDPDAAVSHAIGSGFGLLFLDLTDNRLSTAERPGDMPVGPDGHHGNGNKRYQVISLNTI